MHCQWKDKVLDITASDFEKLALDLFLFQYENNAVYRQYIDTLKVNPLTVKSIGNIPFLPVGFFKSHIVTSTIFEPSVVFESSGTTGSVNSRHYVKDIVVYKDSFTRGFEHFYGPVKDWCILGLLPSYLERENSSLVFMVNELIGLSAHQTSGFYLNDYEKLLSSLWELERKHQKTILIGVTFALLDFADLYKKSNGKPLAHTIVMETGGMKGRRKEMIRLAVHDALKDSFQVPFIHSEYGMTELLSQAYSTGNGIFKCPSWMKVLIRDEENPFDIKLPQLQTPGATGAINVIDLANIYSCCFIATDDSGRLFPDGSFEVGGRIDNSDLRGCSLMVI
jgi:hypothetical protein